MNGLQDNHRTNGDERRVQPVVDCHSDVAIDVYRRRAQGERAVLLRRHFPHYVEGGVVASICTVGGDGIAQSPLGLDRPYESAIAKLEALIADVEEAEGRFQIVTTAAELEACVQGGTHAIVLALEGARPLEGNLARIYEFYDRGLRVIGLCWNEPNEFAIGVDAGREDTGLTPIGAEAVEIMNDLGIAIDLSHASKRTFMDVAGLSHAPLFVSHSNVRAVLDHVRNLDQEQLEAVATSSGVVGLNLYAPFVADGRATLAQLAEHLNVLLATVGPGGVAFGPDFIDYAHPEMMLEVERHPGLYSVDVRYVEQVESVASVQNLVAAAAGTGLDAETVDRIARRNAIRLLRETQTLGKRPARTEGCIG